MAPLVLILRGLVKMLPGGSKEVMFPCGSRTNPWYALLASWYVPVMAPLVLILWAYV